MSEKPEALRLAERIDLRDYYDFDAALHCPDAAIELRRLHAENERLRELLTEARGAKWLVVQDNLLDRIDAALRREPGDG